MGSVDRERRIAELEKRVEQLEEIVEVVLGTMDVDKIRRDLAELNDLASALP